MIEKREHWTSDLGFILAATGSAVGLGNIWRFPYLCGANGGAFFVLIYIFFMLLIGYPMMVSEISIGRKTERNPIGAFLSLAPNTPWWLVGALSVFAGFVILSFYSIVAGWTLSYMANAIKGFSPGMDYQDMFIAHISDPYAPLLWHLVFMILAIIIISLGVVKGIQKSVKIMMPLLFILLLVLVVRGVTLSGSMEGIAFYLAPRLEQVSWHTIHRAIGQAFFSLSLAMGAMITYGSYLTKKSNIADNSAWIVVLDVIVALLAGFAIIPAIFAMGGDPAQGPGLAFIAIPGVFAQMPLGSLFGFVFFLLLSVAALTSAISLLEVVVAWLVDEKNWGRRRTSLLAGFIIFLVGIPASLGYSVFSNIEIFGLDILDTYDFIASDLALPIGGMLTAIFIGYYWKPESVIYETEHPRGKWRIGRWYSFLIRYIIPVMILAIIVLGLIEKFK